MSAPRKLLFVCGSLEPGRDGVGDYTRSLATTCTGLGVECLCLALADPHVSEIREGKEEGIGILRLPLSRPMSSRMERARAAARGFKPSLCSWQLVSYAYSPKGILPRALSTLAAEAPFSGGHAMLHELWIGVEKGSRAKERVIGWIQKQSLRAFLRAMTPRSLHTSTPSYGELISQLGFEARVLPLFGNIPVSIGPAASVPAQSGKLRALLFGTLHPQWAPGDFGAWYRELGKRTQATVELVEAGRLGPHAAKTLSALRAAGIPVSELGPLPAHEISALMGTCDFGVAVHPWLLGGKSGVVAAMLDHGMPVIFPRDDWQPRKGSRGKDTTDTSLSDEPLLLRLSQADKAATTRWLAARRPPAPSLPRVAAQFLAECGLPPQAKP